MPLVVLLFCCRVWLAIVTSILYFFQLLFHYLTRPASNHVITFAMAAFITVSSHFTRLCFVILAGTFPTDWCLICLTSSADSVDMTKLLAVATYNYFWSVYEFLHSISLLKYFDPVFHCCFQFVGFAKFYLYGPRELFIFLEKIYFRIWEGFLH